MVYACSASARDIDLKCVDVLELPFETHEDGRIEVEQQTPDSGNATLSQRWRQFYGIVKESIIARSMTDIQHRVLSPIALCRSQARRRKAQLKKLREITAAGLGVLMDEGICPYYQGHGGGKGSASQTGR